MVAPFPPRDATLMGIAPLTLNLAIKRMVNFKIA